jgi:hypothetical protein
MQDASSPGINVNAKPFTPATAQGAKARSPVVDSVLTQSARLSERVAEAGDLSGLAPDVRMSFMRQAQIESIYGLGDFDKDYEPAEPAVKAIFTMVGEPAAQFRLPLLASIACACSCRRHKRRHRAWLTRTPRRWHSRGPQPMTCSGVWMRRRTVSMPHRRQKSVRAKLEMSTMAAIGGDTDRAEAIREAIKNDNLIAVRYVHSIKAFLAEGPAPLIDFIAASLPRRYHARRPSCTCCVEQH